MKTAREITAQTLAYFPPDAEGHHISAFPKIEGWSCMKWSARDVFEERDSAYLLLAKIALGAVRYWDVAEAASDFFEKQGEQPESYYDEEVEP